MMISVWLRHILGSLNTSHILQTPHIILEIIKGRKLPNIRNVLNLNIKSIFHEVNDNVHIYYLHDIFIVFFVKKQHVIINDVI